MTYWITSSLDNLRFFGINGTSSFSLDKYICISSFSTSRRCRCTRPAVTAPTLAVPDAQTAVTAFITVYLAIHFALRKQLQYLYFPQLPQPNTQRSRMSLKCNHSWYTYPRFPLTTNDTTPTVV